MLNKPPENINTVWDLVVFLDKELGNRAFQSWTPADFVNANLSNYNYSELDLALKQKKLVFYPSPTMDIVVWLVAGSRLWRTNTYLYTVIRALNDPGDSSDIILANLIVKTKENTKDKNAASNEKNN